MASPKFSIYHKLAFMLAANTSLMSTKLFLTDSAISGAVAVSVQCLNDEIPNNISCSRGL